MVKKSKSILVVGFNTRPLVQSLSEAEYEVHAVDFFGDLDLYPHIKECIVVVKRLRTSYDLIKDKYSKYLADFAIEMLKKREELDFLLIGSGLDDAHEGRKAILNELKKNNLTTKSVNNGLDEIKEARDIENVFKFLESQGFKVPMSYSYDKMKSNKIPLKYPFILKKKTGAGGTGVYKINNKEDLEFRIKLLEVNEFISSDWLIQEYIEGIPVSCTTISNGHECEIISINRQIIGEKLLNAPREFMYCGNVVPANLLRGDDEFISKISILLTKKLKLKGINGFDYVLKDHYPYLMEINPRIPGSIRASEEALALNLLNLHVNSFELAKWKSIQQAIKNAKPTGFVTKLILFSPKEIGKYHINEINSLEYIHDKTDPNNEVLKNDPLCTILYKGKSFSESYFNALKIANKINDIIK